MSATTDLHIKKLASEALSMDEEDRPSAECYPMYIQTLYFIFHTVHSDCSDALTIETLQRHKKLLDLAANLVLQRAREHAETLQKSLPKSEVAPASKDRTSSPVCGDCRISHTLPRTSDSSDQLGVISSLPNPTPGSESEEELALRLRRSTTLPAPTRQSTTSLSSNRRVSTVITSSTSSVVTAYPPLTADTYEAFMPVSPLHKAEAENRRLQARFEATQARLSASGGRRGVPTAGMTTRQLQLDRTKFENMELAKKNHEEFLNRLRKLALEVCNDSCTYFRLYRDQFHGQPHLQLLYRQATLYNLFHLRQHVWYQKLVQGRRSAERCLSFVVRDARHPLVGFVRAMASRFFQRLSVAPDDEEIDSLAAIARDLNDELQRLSEVLTLVILHSRADIAEALEVREDEAEDLLPVLSRALYTQTADGPRFHLLAMQKLRQSRAAQLDALRAVMAWPGDRQRAVTEVDPALLTGGHEEDVRAFAEGRGHVRALAQAACPFEKLAAMNRAALAMVEAATRVSGRENARDLGADELTPLFAYVVLCWQEPELLLQCAFLELFAMGKALLGMEGYSLVSLQASVSFCIDAVSEE